MHQFSELDSAVKLLRTSEYSLEAVLDFQLLWVSAVCFSLTCCTTAYKHSKAEHCFKERERERASVGLQSRPVRDSFRRNEGRKGRKKTPSQED